MIGRAHDYLHPVGDTAKLADIEVAVARGVVEDVIRLKVRAGLAVGVVAGKLAYVYVRSLHLVADIDHVVAAVLGGADVVQRFAELFSCHDYRSF